MLGYGSGGPGDRERVARLSAIYVDPAHWSDEVGTALHDRFVSACHQRGFEKYVNNEN